MTNDNDSRPSLLTRRGALRLLALTGASLAAGSETSHAFVDFFASFQSPPRNVLAKLDVPTTWVPQLGFNLANYAQFLDRIKFRQMSVRQVIAPHAKSHGSIHNTLPPHYLWRNIRSTLKVVDQLAERLDMPVEEIISVYRTPAYNARCPGAKSNSYHLQNNAIDIVFNCPPGKVAAMARAMRATGLFKGGVGRYGGFTHIDTRGANADW
ncbi:MAG TPA: D-Ala-D-Ala carboxypeptidase family metallohydrolase [Terrimicrobiaceae bacterium]